MAGPIPKPTYERHRIGLGLLDRGAPALPPFEHSELQDRKSEINSDRLFQDRGSARVHTGRRAGRRRLNLRMQRVADAGPRALDSSSTLRMRRRWHHRRSAIASDIDQRRRYI